MNHAEIDAVLAELALEGSNIQQIWQPSFDTLIMETYKPEGTMMIRICLRSGYTRIHRSTRNFPSKSVQPRFALFLRNRLKGAVITRAEQYGKERIVVLHCLRDGQESQLYIRLWSNAGNIFLCLPDLTILDCAFRRPQRDEMTDGSLELPEPKESSGKLFTPRPHDGFDSLSAYLDAFYGTQEKDERFKQLHLQLSRNLDLLETKALTRQRAVQEQLERLSDPERFRYLGDLLSAQIHILRPGMKFILCDDWFEPGKQIRIDLDPARNGAENAQKWYQKYQKARDSLSWLEDSFLEQERVLGRLGELRGTLALAQEVQDLEKLLAAFHQLSPPKARGDATENQELGARFLIGGFVLIIGRNANENDQLLRRHVKGNDLWLHARDYPGSYVFIKVQKGKSVPLDVLIDAAHLAIWYSKAKNATVADVYYTWVKFLRRVKDGPKGLVIPTQEKNLSIKIDHDHLKALLKN